MDERPAGTLVSVNVGKPRDVAWRGRTVHTGVWKQPVGGPAMVRRLNIDGDGQGDLAGHGGEMRAVLVYQLDSYRHWQRELGRDDFGYGQFGENFTVEGLPDDEVCIGDRYRIGEAVFEVSQPRVTCYRVGIRLGDPRIPALLVAHHRPGFYLRVCTEGTVRPGDEIVRITTGPEQMTVAEIDALLYLPGHTRRQLARAVRIPALSPGWRASFQALLDGSGAGSGGGNAGLTADAGPPPAWPGFRRLSVAGVDRESRSVFSLRLADPTGAPLPAAAAGQFLTVRLRPAGQPHLLRSYSLSGPPGAAGYRISVKLEPHGAASHYLRDHVRAGDEVEAAAPRGSFTLRPAAAPALLISAGVGATPVLAMLHSLAAAGATRQVWWLHSARSGAEHPFAAESRTLLARLPNARAHICYSQPGPDDRFGHDYHRAGRLSAAVLADLGLPPDAEAYICGPTGFMRDVSAALVALGLDRGRIHTEIFGPESPVTPGIAAAPARPPHPPAGPAGSGPPVAFARAGLTVPWDDTYGSLLELAEACDVPTRWSCRTGVCHTCETRLISGAVAYQPDPVEAPAEANLLICCSRPTTELVLDL